MSRFLSRATASAIPVRRASRGLEVQKRCIGRRSPKAAALTNNVTAPAMVRADATMPREGVAPEAIGLRAFDTLEPTVYACRYKDAHQPWSMGMHLKQISKDVRPALAQENENVGKQIAELKVNTSAPPFSGPLPKG